VKGAVLLGRRILECEVVEDVRRREVEGRGRKMKVEVSEDGLSAGKNSGA
jgi:hypothetical protein